jgi:hypothetical protein
MFSTKHFHAAATRFMAIRSIHAHLINSQAQAFSRHLSEKRAGPGPNIRHIRQHDADAVRRQPHPRFRWHLRVKWERRRQQPGTVRDGRWLVGFGVAAAIRLQAARCLDHFGRQVGETGKMLGFPSH